MSKIALITGGTRGIGLGIAQKLAVAGWHLVLNGMREKAAVQDVLESLPTVCTYVQGNIATAEDRQKIMDACKSFGGLDLLVSNAGVAPKIRKDILEIDLTDYDYVMDINLKGTFFLSQMAAKHFERQQRGCIITISSVSAELASIARGEYCMAKAGLAMMTKLLAVRLGSAGVAVYEVRPGVISTDMTAGVLNKYQKMVDEGVFLEPRLGLPEDIGKAVCALAEGSFPYATGQVVTIDGGLTVLRL